MIIMRDNMMEKKHYLFVFEGVDFIAFMLVFSACKCACVLFKYGYKQTL